MQHMALTNQLPSPSDYDGDGGPEPNRGSNRTHTHAGGGGLSPSVRRLSDDAEAAAAVKTEKEFPRAADCRGNTRSCFSPHRMWQLPCSELRHSRFLKLRQGNIARSISRREVGRTNTRGKNRVRTFFGDKVLTHLLAAPFMPSANACCQQRTYYLPTCNSGLFWVWAESFC